MSSIAGYAAGILEVARAEDALARVEADLLEMSSAIEGSSELRDSLSDPSLPTERKLAALNDLFSDHVSELTTSLIRLLVARGAGGSIPEIARSVAEQGAASRGETLAEVRSAIPLDEETVQRLSDQLSRITNKSVEIRTIVDPAILGGIVTRVGDTVIDGSVLKRLTNLRQTLQT